ncbi:unnamed protein product, partial [Brenthis ino]
MLGKFAVVHKCTGIPNRDVQIPVGRQPGTTGERLVAGPTKCRKRIHKRSRFGRTSNYVSAAASRLILIAGDILINTPPARPHRRAAPLATQKKQKRFFARSQRNGKKGGDIPAASSPNSVEPQPLADQSRAGVGAGKRERPRPRFAPAFYLLLRETPRATGV